MSIFLARQALGETKKPSRSLRCSSKRTLVVQGASADVDGIENHYDMLKIFSRAGPGNITAMSQLRECLVAVQATTAATVFVQKQKSNQQEVVAATGNNS